jgi:hypothetical protein
MSLLSEAMESCCFLDKTTQPDGYGGIERVWKEGAGFNAAFTLNSSMEARIAEKQGVTGLYTIITEKVIDLQYHDVVKRLRDNKVFRVTSDGDDKRTPASAALNMRNVSAEEWNPV